jgi:hypothetical protein
LKKTFEKMNINPSEGGLVSVGNPLKQFRWASIRGERVVHSHTKLSKPF